MLYVASHFSDYVVYCSWLTVWSPQAVSLTSVMNIGNGSAPGQPPASTHGNYYNNILRYSELDDTCYSVSMDMCDFHEDCIDGEDERFEKNPDCGKLLS